MIILQEIVPPLREERDLEQLQQMLNYRSRGINSFFN